METSKITPNSSSPSRSCIICSGPGAYLYKSLQDKSFGAPGSWNLARCMNPVCGLSWVDPTLSESEIAQAYASYYTHQDSPQAGPASLLKRCYLSIKRSYLWAKYGYSLESSGPIAKAAGYLLYFFPIKRSEVDEEIRFLHALPIGRLLDVGCGSGAWLRQMEGLGWHAEGLDFDPNAVKVAQDNGLHVSCGSLEDQHYPDNHFDAITLNHVIEHLPDPRATLVECIRILKPNGLLILATPNTDSLGHRWFKRNWRGLEPPRHLYLFCPSAISALFKTAGAGDFHIRTINSNYLWQQSLMLQSESRSLSKALTITALIFTVIEQLLLLIDPKAGECLVVQASKT